MGGRRPTRGRTVVTSTMTLDERVRALAQVLWDYHRMGHALSPADAIMVLCSHDTRVAERGAELFLQGMAPLLIFWAAWARSRVT